MESTGVALSGNTHGYGPKPWVVKEMVRCEEISIKLKSDVIGGSASSRDRQMSALRQRSPDVTVVCERYGLTERYGRQMPVLLKGCKGHYADEWRSRLVRELSTDLEKDTIWSRK